MGPTTRDKETHARQSLKRNTDEVLEGPAAGEAIVELKNLPPPLRRLSLSCSLMLRWLPYFVQPHVHKSFAVKRNTRNLIVSFERIQLSTPYDNRSCRWPDTRHKPELNSTETEEELFTKQP